MTTPLAEHTPCVLCSSPRSTFHANGRTRQRVYCAAHYAAQMCGISRARRIGRAPDGLELLLITPRYTLRMDGAKRSVTPHKFPARWRKLVSFFAAAGWTVTELDRTGATLRRPLKSEGTLP